MRDYTDLLKLLASIWLGLGLVAAAVLVGTRISVALMLFIFGIIIAAAFAPLVQSLKKLLPKRTPRVLTVTVAYLIGLSTAGLIIGLLSLPLIDQSTKLAEQAPALIQRIPEALPYLEGVARDLGFDVETNSLVLRFSEQLQAFSQVVFGGIASGLLAVFSAVGQIAVAVIISVYMLASASQLKERLLEAVPERYRDDAEQLGGRLTGIVSGFIRGQLILSVSIGAPVGILLWVIGVPFSALLGLIAGLAELIPVVGSYLGAIPAILVTLIFLGPYWALIVLAIFVGVNLLSSNILYPRLVGGLLGLHPLVVIFALIAGYQLIGFWGALFGAPAASVMWAIWQQAHASWPQVRGEISKDSPADDDGR